MVGANSYSVMACRHFCRCNPAHQDARTVVTEDDMGEAYSLQHMGGVKPTKIEGILVADKILHFHVDMVAAHHCISQLLC